MRTLKGVRDKQSFSNSTVTKHGKLNTGPAHLHQVHTRIRYTLIVSFCNRRRRYFIFTYTLLKGNCYVTTIVPRPGNKTKTWRFMTNSKTQTTMLIQDQDETAPLLMKGYCFQ